MPSLDNDYIEAATRELARAEESAERPFGFACLGIRLCFGGSFSDGPL